jgi:hypothetical protein
METSDGFLAFCVGEVKNRKFQQIERIPPNAALRYCCTFLQAGNVALMQES